MFCNYYRFRKMTNTTHAKMIMRGVSRRLLNVALKSMFFCVVAPLAVSQVIPEAILKCKSEADDGRRLQCYDREVNKYPLTADQSFGLNPSQVSAGKGHSSGVAPKEERSIIAQVVTIQERPNRGFITELDNGQVWMQYENESIREVRVGDTVKIRSGALGSFWLVGPSGWITKVNRLR